MTLAKSYWEIPGPRGQAGTDGSDGSDGVSSYTTTTAQFTMPAEGADVTVAVGDSRGFAVGQMVAVGGPLVANWAGYMEVRAKPSQTQLTLRNSENTATDAYTDNVAPGTVVGSGRTIAPAGIQGAIGPTGAAAAFANAYYLVSQPTDIPTNGIDLGSLSTGLLKLTVAAGAATPSIGVSGVDFQGPDAELTAIAGLVSAADRVPYFTGSGTAALATFTAAGRALVDDANATAQRATLGLDTMATQAASAVAVTGGTLAGVTLNGTITLTNVLNITKSILNTLAAGTNAAVAVGNYTFIKLTAGPVGAFSIDGIAGGTDGRLLIIYNATGQDMTIANESGGDPTAANRITTMTGGDVAGTTASAALLMYDGTASRWLLLFHTA